MICSDSYDIKSSVLAILGEQAPGVFDIRISKRLIFQRINLQLTKGNFSKLISSELTQALGPVARRVGSIENI
jgi:hypothetical protein